MVILFVERAPAGLRGELSRWMIEPRAGVFVGNISAMVRDRLWTKACKEGRDAGAMLLYSSQTEQGFTIRTFGDTSRTPVDLEGITLVRVPYRPRPPARHTGEAGEPNLPDAPPVRRARRAPKPPPAESVVNSPGADAAGSPHSPDAAPEPWDPFAEEWS